MKLTLVIGNKNYSSWSLRPWLVLKQTGIPFKEIKILIHQKNSIRNIEKYSKAGRVPILIDGKTKVWESLAICEYLAERFPKKNLWPKNPSDRAYARSISHEMHAGFQNLRSAMPMDARAFKPLVNIPENVRHDISRITEIWKECRKKSKSKGNFLFGVFSIADAMYAPVCFRFKTYGVQLDPISKSYQDHILSLPVIQEWLGEAFKEPALKP